MPQRKLLPKRKFVTNSTRKTDQRQKVPQRKLRPNMQTGKSTATPVMNLFEEFTTNACDHRLPYLEGMYW